MKYIVIDTIPYTEQEVLNKYAKKGYRLVTAIEVDKRKYKLYLEKNDTGED